jgi:hypothetical protein
MSKDHRKRAIPFIVLGMALVVIGSAGQRILILIGVVFWIIGLRMLVPPRR